MEEKKNSVTVKKNYITLSWEKNEEIVSYLTVLNKAYRRRDHKPA